MQPSLSSQQPAPVNIVIVNNNRGPNILVRLLWFVFIGMWLGSIVTWVGYLFCLTVILLPLGLTMLNALPKIMTLRAPSNKLRTVTVGSTTTITMGSKQVPMLFRILYYFAIGWWLGGLWLGLAWIISLFWWVPPFMFMALAFWMFDRVPAVMTLRTN